MNAGRDELAESMGEWDIVDCAVEVSDDDREHVDKVVEEERRTSVASTSEFENFAGTRASKGDASAAFGKSTVVAPKNLRQPHTPFQITSRKSQNAVELAPDLCISLPEGPTAPRLPQSPARQQHYYVSPHRLLPYVRRHAHNGRNSAIYPPNDSVASNGHASSSTDRKPGLSDRLVDAYDELQAYREGNPVIVDGHTLSIAAVAAAARYGAAVALGDRPETRERVARSRRVIVDKVNAQRKRIRTHLKTVYTADTRSNNPLLLGQALLQHQQAGALLSQTEAPLQVLPLGDPLAMTSMPEARVRGAIVIRMNSLICGHSGIRWELIEKLGELLRESITPLVPLRGSISASGEHLGILNGTAFSTSIGALALNEVVHLSLLAQVCTTMSTESMTGAVAFFNSFIHVAARPHPGQIEVARNIRILLGDSQMALKYQNEAHITEDEGELRQDRYPLRTSAQFLGPQIEDILSALNAATVECSSTTDNPLVDGETGAVHHGGNFRAMAVTSAMEKTRLAIYHIGKLLFSQCTELINPAMNRRLPPNLASTDPSHNYFTKGVDIHTAAYVSELGYLATPASTHIQSAEMHNQAVNSLALISARYTITAIDVLSLLTASYLLVLCQALDLRSMHHDLQFSLSAIVRELVPKNFPSVARHADVLMAILERVVFRALDTTSTADCKARMYCVAASTTTSLVDFLSADLTFGANLGHITGFRAEFAERAAGTLMALRMQYLEGARSSAPASRHLGKTRAVYEFVRVTLGVRVHGAENLRGFEMGPGVEDGTVGGYISVIYEAIRDGKMQGVIIQLVRPPKAGEAPRA
ncbi:uncharacterized protein PHACADRAFT_213640 [Phanerochaete carnosa HHB-10118-sp]|uniref:Phenylalanine ammonia-lyase n=1 Tax=Phanerochaete carnosa (strain HHB-10118-sp) TaxID=650164 RepID=K5UM21_PHACS|nr:uncharacterized protein PHACADRAFT_213640 [Phanerochaete carnosa HHB-10118-sp]EKM50751.1 hypothetical protein PHACADRAFT_213640 [Phanerochaete carnosa HHB-10118-sp]